MDMIPLNTNMAGSREDWTFIGDDRWTQDDDGVIRPPVWVHPNFDTDPNSPPNAYAHELAREDCAFIGSEALDDTDVSVQYKCPYGSVLNGGIVFRALDTARMYVLN
ncbi:MAG: hypothetical protein GY851_08120, partial [bacterium]|nr:hypothetical protein [bacterium]